MTEREQYLNKCLNDIAEYCKEHKESCIGCIFYNQVNVGSVIIATCKINDSELWS